MHVALYHPEIPPNTGNIGRLCVGMGAELHLIGPCAFDLSTKALRRAGLDYWPHLHWQLHADEDRFLAWLGEREPWLVTKFATRRFDQAPYQHDDVILLGNEVTGLPEAWHERWPDRGLAIPILGQIRSYNLANAAAMVLAQASLATGRFDAWQPPQREGSLGPSAQRVSGSAGTDSPPL
jgi:tRNA (cytidine/uridine-2'-O-)-methyltransferase